MRRQHITRLQSIDLIIGRNLRILELEFLPTIHGKFAKLFGCFILTGAKFEIIIMDNKVVNALSTIEKPKNKAIHIHDFGVITVLD